MSDVLSLKPRMVECPNTGTDANLEEFCDQHLTINAYITSDPPSVELDNAASRCIATVQYANEVDEDIFMKSYLNLVH